MRELLVAVRLRYFPRLPRGQVELLFVGVFEASLNTGHRHGLPSDAALCARRRARILPPGSGSAVKSRFIASLKLLF